MADDAFTASSVRPFHTLLPHNSTQRVLLTVALCLMRHTSFHLIRQLLVVRQHVSKHRVRLACVVSCDPHIGQFCQLPMLRTCPAALYINSLKRSTA